MLRPLYVVGTIYAALCAFAIGLRPFAGRTTTAVVYPQGQPTTSAPSAGGDVSSGAAWFERMRPHCNPVEAEVQLRFTPPPATADGAAYAAACYALAGKIERARATIDALPSGGARSAAANLVFAVGHPVADAGDDAAAGPIMRLVVEYQPDNYMALYHAGMSEYALGHADLARDLLRHFERIYTVEDGWRSNAREVLGRLDRNR